MVSNIVYTTKKTTITRFIYTLVQDIITLHNFHRVCYFACVNNFCYLPSSFTSKLWHDFMLGFESQQIVDLCMKDIYIQWGCYHVCYHGNQLSSGAAGRVLSLLHHDGNWGHCGFNNGNDVFILFLSVKTMQLYTQCTVILTCRTTQHLEYCQLATGGRGSWVPAGQS